MFRLSKDQESLRDDLRRLFVDLSSPAKIFELWRTAATCDEDLWAALAAGGWFGIAIPEVDGGAGLDVPELAILAEEHGATGAVGPVVETALAGKFVAAMPASAIRHALLQKIARGDARVAFGFSSARLGVRRDPQAGIQGKVRGDEIVLNGTCMFVPWAKSAGILIVEARIDGRDTLCLVDREQGDVRLRDMETIDPGTAWSDVSLAELVLPRDHILPICPDAALVSAAVLISAGLLGASRKCLSVTVEYAKVRKQFGREIGSFQAVQHICADMLCGVESLDPPIRFAALCATASSAKAPYYASVARVHAEEVATMVWTNALQIHGGIGFSWEHELHIYLKRILALQAQYGSLDIHRERVVRSGVAFAGA